MSVVRRVTVHLVLLMFLLMPYAGAFGNVEAQEEHGASPVFVAAANDQVNEFTSGAFSIPLPKEYKRTDKLKLRLSTHSASLSLTSLSSW